MNIRSRGKYLSPQRKQGHRPSLTGRAVIAWGIALILAGLGTPAVSRAKEKKKAKPKRAVVATSASAKGMIFRRENFGRPWHVVSAKEKLSSGDMLIGLPGAKVDSKNKAVRLLLMADLDRTSPYPVRENAVILHNNKKVDLDLTLDRGRIDLINRKKKGPAHVLLRVRKTRWELTLQTPGTSLALGLYGRWEAGARFTPKPTAKDVPTSHLLFLVIKGEVDVKDGGFEHALTAPPGPALMEWDSVTGHDETPKRLDKLPPWADENRRVTPEVKEKQARLKRFRNLVLKKGIGKTLDTLVKSDDLKDRALAVLGMGVFDDLPRLRKALMQAKHPDVWDTGVLVLRHWIGRGPGQDQRLYQAILKSGKVTPAYAESIMQLLHSFGENELARPELYQTLIDYLEHSKLAVRGLAYWHLSRLVPEGQKFGYNLLDPKKKRAAAVAKWRKLIPRGKMPPNHRTENKD
jgi:hypothetical protein